jgi:NADP-dependent 3-hydroxy acid dehydrogenase YdfG
MAIALADRRAKVALRARSTHALEELAQRLPHSLPVTLDVTRLIECGTPLASCTGITAASLVS